MYWHDNVGGLANVLSACASAGIRDVVFSSSAAVYGMPDVDLVTEDLTPQPINPYGATKYVGEWMLADAERAHGLRSEEHTSELQSRGHLVCRLLLVKQNQQYPK